VLAAVSGGANPLWLTEWLAEAMPLQTGVRVLDLGCGRGASSVFLNREFVRR
jgi:cyclopropane fatty-acyl-phospholipid synthase-like methyltransferase